MAKGKGETRADTGQDCPALERLAGNKDGFNEITINGERLRIVQATDKEREAIIHCLRERAKSAPAGAHIDGVSALARAGLKFVAVVFLATSVGIGLGDGNLYDDVGPNVAQQPDRPSHGADARQSEEHLGGNALGSGGGASGGKTESGKQRPECEARAEICVYRMPDGRCQATNQPCRLLPLPIADCGLAIEQIGGRTAEALTELRTQQDLLTRLIRGQEKLLAGKLEKSEVGIQNAELSGRTAEILHQIGQFQYRPGFEDVWLGGEHYDLRKRRKARLCLEYLVTRKAFNAASARHFENEIDPFVRKKGRLGARGKFSEIQIKQYFNDREGRLPMLRKGLIRAVAGNGKYYLWTGEG